MTYPTPEEIREAFDAITRDGPMAETTIRLGALVLHDPILRGIVSRMTHAADRGVGMPTEAAIIAAMVAGLNYGLRIAEQRMRAAPDTPESQTGVVLPPASAFENRVLVDTTVPGMILRTVVSTVLTAYSYILTDRRHAAIRSTAPPFNLARTPAIAVS